MSTRKRKPVVRGPGNLTLDDLNYLNVRDILGRLCLRPMDVARQMGVTYGDILKLENAETRWTLNRHGWFTRRVGTGQRFMGYRHYVLVEKFVEWVRFKRYMRRFRVKRVGIYPPGSGERSGHEIALGTAPERVLDAWNEVDALRRCKVRLLGRGVAPYCRVDARGIQAVYVETGDSRDQYGQKVRVAWRASRLVEAGLV